MDRKISILAASLIGLALASATLVAQDKPPEGQIVFPARPTKLDASKPYDAKVTIGDKQFEATVIPKSDVWLESDVPPDEKPVPRQHTGTSTLMPPTSMPTTIPTVSPTP